MDSFDVVVVGGGISGASIAYELATDRSVALLEQESQLAYHSTGRSAASFVESIGPATVRALSKASRGWLEQPPAEFAEQLVTPLPVVYFSADGDGPLLDFYREVGTDVTAMRLLDHDELAEVCPILRPELVERAILESSSMAIDVHALHSAYIRGLRQRGGSVIRSTGLAAAEYRDGTWSITDRNGQRIAAAIVVNAAGAWADTVAHSAGVRPIGITPYRRTIFTVDPPAGCDPTTVPMLIEIGEQFYVKPEPGQFLCSPAEEQAQPAGDARAGEIDIARALDAINEYTAITARHVKTSWGGLRSFAADRLPVVGFDDEVDGFFWYCGQGGYGVQTSPALSRVGAAIARGEPPPADLTDIDPVRIAPARLR